MRRKELCAVGSWRQGYGTVVSHLCGVTLKWSPPSQYAGNLLFTLSLSHLSGHFSGSGQKYAGVTLKWSDHLSVTLLYYEKKVVAF